MSVDEIMRAAFAALLRGDIAERDRLCAEAEKALNAEAQARALEKLPIPEGTPRH